MKLYEIPKKSVIVADATSGEGKTIKDAHIVFHHLDGAYSYCTVNELDNAPVHIACYQELELQNDGTYKLK